MLIILLLCVSFCCAGNIGLSTNKLTNLISKNAPIASMIARRQSAPIFQSLKGLPTHRSAPIASMIVRSQSAPISQSTKEKILKIENNKRKQTFVAKAKSSEFVHEQHLDNKKEQQFKFSFMEYWTTVNVYLGYKGATYEYLGRYVPPKVTATIALNMLNALQRYLYELIEVSFDVPKVLTPEHFVFIRKNGDQFSQDELIGNIRVEFDSKVPRVEDPRQRALANAQQSKIIWAKDFLYMSPQQIKNFVNVSGEKDIVWSMGIILYEMIYGYNPFGDPKRTIQPKQQWHWIPLNDEKGEMKEVFKKIEDEQEYINLMRNATLNSLDKHYPRVACGGGLEEFDSLLGECLQKDPEKRVSLNELSKRLEQIKQKLPNDKAVFKDRQDAGQKLAKVLSYLDQLKKDELVVLALPRGGVPVAYEIAKSLKAPLDLLFAKKIGFPGNEEIGIGAVAEGNPPHLVTNAKAMEILKLSSTDQYIHEQMEVKLREIERQRKKLANRPPIPLEGRAVIVVDDGMATGVTALAALQKLREANVAVVILASPVCSLDTINHLQDYGYELVCLETPRYFTTVSQYYERFDQISDEEVIRFLDNANVWMGKSGDE